MIFAVEITSRARLDLKMMYEYIAGTLMEPVIAEKQYTRIENAVYYLNKMPERFPRYENEPWRSRNLRLMPVDNYIVFYIVDNGSRTVTVLRIMYGRRNIKKELDHMAQHDD